MEPELEIALDALFKISQFGHTEDCRGMAPVHECGCQPQSEREIARDALDKIEAL